MKLEKLSFEDLNLPNILSNIKNKDDLNNIYSDIDIFFKIYFTISGEICDAL